MLQRVRQEHDSGCFVAAVATLLQVSYYEAFARLFPGQSIPSLYDNIRVSRLIEESLALLPQVGIGIQLSKLRSVRSLKKRTALIILRWRHEPHLSHAVVFDGEQGKILDPCYESPLNNYTYNRNLEAIYYVKRTQSNATQLPVPSLEPLRSSLPNTQVPSRNPCGGCPLCGWANARDW